MSRISQYMTRDHRDCDARFAGVEEAVSGGDWQAAAVCFGGFQQAMEHHFGREEDTLFPLFEQATGSTQGPTEVMRREHEQMRGLIGQMAAALQARDTDTCLGVAETLLIMMQQHNLKEEQILYPMSDQVLAGSDVLERLQQA